MTMSADVLSDKDRYAEDVSRLLGEHGLLAEDEAEGLKRYIRGW